MTNKEAQLKQLYELKKKLDRQVRNQEKLDYYNEQKEQIKKQAADTALLPLKKTDHEADLRKRFQRNNRYTRPVIHGLIMAAAIVALAALCVLMMAVMFPNANQLLTSGGFFPSVELDKPLEGVNSPSFYVIFYTALTATLLLLILFLPLSSLKPQSVYGFIFRALTALVVGAGTVVNCFHLLILSPVYVIMPVVAIIIAIALRIYHFTYQNADRAALTSAQTAQLKKAAATDAVNKQVNVHLKRQGVEAGMAERQQELQRIDEQILQIRNDMIRRDLQMRDMNVLPMDEFVTLPRLLEFLESGQARDLAHARQLYSSEQAQLQRKADADKRRSQELLVMLRLQDTLMSYRRDEAYRAMNAAREQHFHQTEREKDYLKALENYIESERN